MTYEQAKEFIDNSNQYGNKLGLTTITELLRRLGNPQDKLKVIHVAGTNGKGSTTAFIAAILASEGYRIGRYVSPAVFNSFEWVQLSNKGNNEVITTYITEQGVTDIVNLIEPVCGAMIRDGYDHPTFYELQTTMAILFMVQQQVDFAVIEVLMGGRLDATNVFQQPLCSVITSISMDHMQYLGDSLEKIALEKAGIIKRGVPVVTGNTQPQVVQVLSDICRQQEAKLVPALREEASEVVYSPEGTRFTYQQIKYKIKLLGDYQISNALLAIEAVRQLRAHGIILHDKAIEEGLLTANWKGRFEVLDQNPYFIIDGAHNEDAALQLKKAIELYFSDRRLIFIIGVLADKDYESILRSTASLADVIFTITPKNNRALASMQLAIEAKKYCSGHVIDMITVSEAIHFAYKEAKKEDVIIAFGSLSYLSEVEAALLSR